MKFIITDNYEEMSKTATEMVIAVIKEKTDAVICFPTGSTPLRMYELLIAANKAGEVDFSEVRVRSVDEYFGLSGDHDQSYAYFLHEYLLDHINVKKDNVLLIDGGCEDPEAECRRYQALIDRDGGIDLYIDGVGANGHIGFNEPASEMVLDYHLQEVSEHTRIANSRFFASLEEVPKQALTIGVNNILAAKKAIFLSNGEHKAEAWRRFTQKAEVSTEFPLSFLHLATNATAILDKASAKYLK